MACSAPRTAQPADADAKVTVVSGSLEGSNANMVESMVNMISLARQFDMQMKMLHNGGRQRQTSQRRTQRHRLIFIKDTHHDSFPVDRQDRHGSAADADGCDLQQPGQRQHQRLQAFARGVRGSAVPEHPPAGRAVVATDADTFRLADRYRRAADRDRTPAYPGQPATDQQPAGCGDPGRGLLPGPAARRHDGAIPATARSRPTTRGRW